MSTKLSVHALHLNSFRFFCLTEGKQPSYVSPQYSYCCCLRSWSQWQNCQQFNTGLQISFYVCSSAFKKKPKQKTHTITIKQIHVTEPFLYVSFKCWAPFRMICKIWWVCTWMYRPTQPNKALVFLWGEEKESMSLRWIAMLLLHPRLAQFSLPKACLSTENRLCCLHLSVTLSPAWVQECNTASRVPLK